MHLLTSILSPLPSQVARDLVKGVERRAFSVWTGLDGFMLASLTCGMEPCFGILAALVQVLTCSLFRLVSLVYLLDFYRISNRCSVDCDNRQKLAKGEGPNGGTPALPPRKYVPQLPVRTREASSADSASPSPADIDSPSSLEQPRSVTQKLGGLVRFRRGKKGGGGSD